jgi:hypothetical protein
LDKKRGAGRDSDEPSRMSLPYDTSPRARPHCPWRWVQASGTASVGTGGGGGREIRYTDSRQQPLEEVVAGGRVEARVVACGAVES